MVARPPLPSDYDLPTTVGEWVHNPDSGKNAHVWTARDEPVTVGVFAHFGGEVVAKVFDDRVDGFGQSVELYHREYNDESGSPVAKDRREAETVATVIDQSIDWMRNQDPSEWTHPDVCEAVFDAPAGYSLERYYLEDRTATIYYRRDGAEKAVRLAGSEMPEELTAENCPYLYVHVWRGSGKATVAVAPWLRAHGPASKHPEIREVVETPDECGLEVAVTLARQWVREQFGGEADVTSGQTDLAAFSGGSA